MFKVDQFYIVLLSLSMFINEHLIQYEVLHKQTNLTCIRSMVASNLYLDNLYKTKTE